MGEENYVSRILLVVLSGMFLATPALAQQRGGYVGAGIVSASTDNASDFATTVNGPAGSGDKTATGLKVYGGYMFSPYVGVEAGYYDLGTYDVKFGATKTDEFKTTAFAVSAVGSWPLGTAFNLNGKLGLAFTSVDYTCVVACGGPFVNTSKSDVSPLLGIGVGWKATRNFSLRADLEYFSDVNHAVSNVESKFSYTAFSVSGQYNF
jgi:OOP family OmpA-OmpF porin